MTRLADEKLAALESKTREKATTPTTPAKSKTSKTSHARDAKPAQNTPSESPAAVPAEVPEGGNDHAMEDAAAAAVSRDHEALKDYAPRPGQELAFVLLPDGDALVTVRIRESYATSAADLADEAGQTLTQWVQERMDFWMENEFAMVQSR
jgi:hypothetical protein